MVQKSKSKPARKTAARKAAPAKPRASAKKAAPRKVAPKKAVAKKPAAKKAAVKKPARRRQGAAAPRPAKSKNIFRKKARAAKPRAREEAAPVAAPKEASAPAAAARMAFEPPLEGERRTGTSDFPVPGQGRPAARRPTPDEADAESAEAPVRVNKLVPTNAVHTTKRRMKRNAWQSPALGIAAIVAVMAILVLGRENAPPDVSPLERRAETGAGARAPALALAPRLRDPQLAAPDRALRTPARAANPAGPTWSGDSARPGENRASDPGHGLKVLELVEMERMLKRLDMEPSRPDGVVDGQTVSAIRMYQQIAGLPIDGAPSAELLDDMREVVKLLDGEN